MDKETLEEAAEKVYPINIVVDYDTNEDIRTIFIEGAKWMEQEMEKLKDFDTWKEWKSKLE